MRRRRLSRPALIVVVSGAIFAALSLSVLVVWVIVAALGTTVALNTSANNK